MMLLAITRRRFVAIRQLFLPCRITIYLCLARLPRLMLAAAASFLLQIIRHYPMLPRHDAFAFRWSVTSFFCHAFTMMRASLMRRVAALIDLRRHKADATEI